jgi:hypothetical protein
VALGASLSGTKLSSTLTPAQQVPPQAVKAPQARATFAATLTRIANGRGKLTWRLSYAHLSSPVTKAFIDVPRTSSKPEVVVQFCGACTAGASGVVMPLPLRVANALESRSGWVSIRTKRNPKGEIRGRLVVRQ